MSRFVSTALCALAVFSFGMTSAQAGPKAAAPNAAAGKAIYDANCSSCHKDGIMAAPKTGDPAAWAPRIKQGMPVLISNSIKGFTGKKGVMMPKAGNPKLTDAEVTNAVAYMVSQVK